MHKFPLLPRKPPVPACNFTPVSYLDIILVVPLLWAGYRGFSKGLIIELASFGALVLGVFGGIHFSNYASEALIKLWEMDTEYLPVISFAITFIVIVGAVFALAKVLEKVVNLMALKLVNKLAGGLFGLAKMGMILSVVLVILNSLDSGGKWVEPEEKEKSVLYEHVASLAPTIIPAIGSSDWYHPGSADDEEEPGPDKDPATPEEVLQQETSEASVDL